MQDTAVCFDRQHWACWVFAFVVGVSDGAGEVWVMRLPFCLDPIVTWVYRVRLTEDGRNLMALFCLFLFGGAECLPCLFSHSYFFHLFVRRGNRRIRLGTSPACDWRVRIVGKKLFLSTWFFAAVLTTKLKNAQFCTCSSQNSDIYLFCIYFMYIIQNWLFFLFSV